MVINWYGEGCFKVQSGEISIMIDPFGPETGLQTPRSKTNAVLKTASEYPPLYETTVATLIAGPGEYDIQGIKITGWPAGENSKGGKERTGLLKTVYRVIMEDISLGFLGNLSAMPAPEIMEEFGQTDVLFAPAGGEPFLSQENAAKLIKQIGPKIVVASFFKIPGLKRKASDVKEFLKELGRSAEPAEKLVLKKKDLPPQMTAAVLKA